MKSELGQLAVRSTAWFGATRLCVQTLSWASTLIVARLLSPADYGLFGMALSVINILQIAQELGLGTAIVQKRDLSTKQVSGVFWIVTGASLFLAFVGYILAPAVALYYRERALTAIVRAMAAIFLIGAMGTVPYSLLTREIDFKKRSLADGYGAIASIAVSLSLAFAGYGVWALVFGNLAQTFVRNAAMLLYSGWWPTVTADFRGVWSMFTFGVKVAGGSIIGRAYSSINPMIIGKLLGQDALGYFAMADSLGNNNPINKVSVTVLNQLSLPMFSKLQDDLLDLKNAFLRMTKYLTVIGLPAQLGMALIARDLITVMLTPQWIAIVPLVQVFSLSGIFYVVPLPCAPLLIARGRAGAVLKNSVVTTTVMVIAVIAGSTVSLQAVAVWWIAMFGVARSFLLWLTLRELHSSVREFFAELLKPAIASAVMVFSVTLARQVAYGHLPGVRLGQDVIVGALSYILAMVIIDGKIVKDLVWAARALVPSSRGIIQ